VQALQGRFKDGAAAVELIASCCEGRPVALLDIGGYFADIGDFVRAYYTGGLLGIVEDTENGVQKYERGGTSYPLLSVARSPLKHPEDFLVGQPIVYSVEALLREQGHILHGRTVCVIGYGKLGRSVAHLLHARHLRTLVYDRDPIRQVEAMSHGFPVGSDLRKALRDAGLVICATGNLALRRPDFALLEDGAYVATVTSSDDELEIGDLHRDYDVEQVADHMVRYSRHGHHFHLMNGGQAVNFVHGAAVEAYIYLVQAEMLAGLSSISKGEAPVGISESSNDVRRHIADIWLHHFGPDARGKASDA
jgi:adenosylhomocysteinase